jgi:transporter family protein
MSLFVAWGYYGIEGREHGWPIPGLLWFTAVGLTGGFGARYLSFFSINRIGLARTSVIVQISLVFSSAMAVVTLGESITFMVGLGTLSIMFGAILLVYRQGEAQKSMPLQHHVYALLTAMCLAMAHLFMKFGFQWLPSASLGMAVSTASALIMMIFTIFLTEESFPRNWKRKPMFIVAVGGLVNGLAGVFFLTAIKSGRVVEVVPINRLSVLLIIFFSWVFFRQQEAITLRVVLDGLLSVVGAFAIVSGR